MECKPMNYLDHFHKIVINILIVFITLVVFLATLDLIYLILKDVLFPPFMLLEAGELLDIFGYFLLILIGVELLETLRIYLRDHALNVQVVLLVAMIAIARKVITLKVEETESLTLIGIAFIIASLAAGYYLVKKSQDERACKIL